jgi:hypothetical protein
MRLAILVPLVNAHEPQQAVARGLHDPFAAFDDLKADGLGVWTACGTFQHAPWTYPYLRGLHIKPKLGSEACLSRAMSETGQTRPMDFAHLPPDVRCCSKSDHRGASAK